MGIRYVRISAENARNKGIDWTSRSLFFPARKDTITLLEQLVKDLKDERDTDDQRRKDG